MLKERIFRNIFSHGMGRVFEMTLGVLLIPFLIGKLSASGFGIIILAESLIQIFDMAMTGLRTGLGRHLGICLARQDRAGADSFLATGEFLLFGILAIFALAGVLLWFYFPIFFNIPAEFKSQSRLFISMMILAGILQARMAPSFAVLYSFQRFDLLNIYNACRNIARSLLCFAVYFFFPARLDYYGFIYFAAVFTEQTLIWKGAGKIFLKAPARIKNFSWSKCRELFSFMFYRIIQSVSGVLHIDTAMILINKFMGPNFNAIYSISLKFVDVMERLIRQSLGVIVPSFTELIGREEFDRTRRVYISMTKLGALVSLPICFFFLLFGRELIHLWVGPKFLPALKPMYINVIAYAPLLVFAPSGGIATAFAKIKIPSFVTLATVLVNIAIGAFFGLRLGWGLAGFAFGTLCAFIFEDLLFNPLYACRLIGLDPLPYYYASFLRPLALSVLVMAPVFIFKRVFLLPPIFVLTAMVICVLIYLYCAYAWVMDSYERQKFGELFGLILKKRKGKFHNA